METDVMTPLFEQIDLKSADSIADALFRGAEAAQKAKCRRGSIDFIATEGLTSGDPAATLIATGDLHDNPLHLYRLAKAASMIDEAGAANPNPSQVKHLTLHELIHSDRLINDMDFSFRVLARVAMLKAAFPERVHVLLANHEIAQATNGRVVKEGIDCVKAFNEAIDASFGAEAGKVHIGVKAFIGSMALACRVRTTHGDILCSHSLPAAELMDRVDMHVLERPLKEDDWHARIGTAHLMTWGRNLTRKHLLHLADLWKVRLFILGHEKAEDGAFIIDPNTIVLNSDHDKGVYLPIDLSRAQTPDELIQQAVPLSV
jgi:hypothetical protein